MLVFGHHRLQVLILLLQLQPTQSVLHDPACGPTSVADSVQDLAATTNLATASSR